MRTAILRSCRIYINTNPGFCDHTKTPSTQARKKKKNQVSAIPPIRAVTLARISCEQKGPRLRNLGGGIIVGISVFFPFCPVLETGMGARPRETR